jgi:hypothetical protein
VSPGNTSFATVIVSCRLCHHDAITVRVASDGELDVAPTRHWPGDPRDYEVVPADSAHQLIHVGCDRMYKCGWLSDVCACQFRDQAGLARARGRRPWRWSPSPDERRDALRHRFGDDT